MFVAEGRRHVVINEQGAVMVTHNVQIQNKFDKPESLTFFGFEEATSDVVDISVRDSKNNTLSYEKLVSDDFASIKIDLNKIRLDVNETYLFTCKYTIPSMVKLFDKTYFYKELEVYSRIRDWADILEVTMTCELPKLFSKYQFWKETYISAPRASRIYTKNGLKIVEHKIGVPKGSHREISFMFQERHNSKITNLLSFFLGVGLLQFFDWLANLIL